jgi:cation transport regulator ChaC
VFASNTAHADHVGEQPLAQTATVIATATGPIGSNRAYLEQLVAQLSLLGVEDDYVAALWQRVCSLPAAGEAGEARS